MNTDAPIPPELIEQYCLGLMSQKDQRAIVQQASQNAVLKQQIDRFMEQLEIRLRNEASAPPAAVKTKTLLLLNNLQVEQHGSLEERPVLNKYSDYKNWLRLLKPLLPQKLDGNMFVQEFRNDEQVSQTLIWTRVDYPDEVHSDVHESFIILQGRCRCFIDGKAVDLGAGDYLEIPMHKHHDVRVLEVPVLALVQRIKVASSV